MNFTLQVLVFNSIKTTKNIIFVSLHLVLFIYLFIHFFEVSSNSPVTFVNLKDYNFANVLIKKISNPIL